MNLHFLFIFFLLAIVLVFLDEFSRLTKKLIGLPGLTLLGPLLLASWLIELYGEWGNWLLVYIQFKMNHVFQSLSLLIPFRTGSLHLVRIVSLFSVACFPMILFNMMGKRKGIYATPVYLYYIGFICWIIAVFLLTTNI